MKPYKFAALVLALGVSLSGVLQAQDQNAPSGEGRRGRGGQGQGGRGQMMTADERVAQLDKAVSLTAEQKPKIKEIYTKAEEQMREAFRGGGGGDRETARNKMVEMMRKTREDVRALLTDEQKKKFDEMPQRGGGNQGGRSQGKRGGNKN